MSESQFCCTSSANGDKVREEEKTANKARFKILLKNVLCKCLMKKKMKWIQHISLMSWTHNEFC